MMAVIRKRRGEPGKTRSHRKLPWSRRGTSAYNTRSSSLLWRRWNRLMPLLTAVAVVIATLAGILFLNIKISDGQYRLVELRSQERSVAQESEALTQDLEFHQAPQNLAVAATEEGMVPTSSEGVVDLRTGEVSGQPEPAQEIQDDEILVPQPVQRGSAAADRATSLARERRDALPQTQEEVDRQLRAAQEAENGLNLHGGSLPAPQQRNPADETPQPSPTVVPTGDPRSAVEADEREIVQTDQQSNNRDAP